MREWWTHLKLRSRILIACAAMFFVSLLITARSTLQTNTIIAQMEDSFATNRQLLDVLNRLETIEADVEDYLNTRSTQALEAYYEHVREYTDAVASFATKPSSLDTDILEKNIVRMSATYLAVADQAIAEKRGRDIDAYQATYTELTLVYRHLRAMMSALNDRQFERNAVDNDSVIQSASSSARSSLLILALIVLLAVFLIIMLRRMVDPIESAMKEREIRMETQVKDAELKYLRAQVNPHFLFNTLNAGTQLAMMEGAERTYQYLHKVADFYRYIVRQEGVSTTLRQEVDIVDDFIYIINARYGGDILYDKEIDESLLALSVPSMILQPIVENCTKHGLAEKEGEKRIVLRANHTNGVIEVSVSDNGNGMEETVITDLLREDVPDAEGTGEETVNPAGRGVGLRNVLKRLRMYYNKEDVMRITSGTEGTTVTLLLPEETEDG